jgi:hypothetical protein
MLSCLVLLVMIWRLMLSVVGIQVRKEGRAARLLSVFSEVQLVDDFGQHLLTPNFTKCNR